MLKSRLPSIGPEIQARLEAECAKTAEHVAEAARERVPVDTGALRDAIHVEPAEHGIGEFVVAGNTEAWYGHLVEYGTVNTDPRPFLLPAAEANRKRHAANAHAALKGL
jgi:HK97 gp10 family phage protein